MIINHPEHKQASTFYIYNKFDSGNEVIYMYSYSTRVIEIELVHIDGVKQFARLTCHGLYSRTTIKHISWFARRYLDDLDYYNIKASFISDKSLRLSVTAYERITQRLINDCNNQ